MVGAVHRAATTTAGRLAAGRRAGVARGTPPGAASSRHGSPVQAGAGVRRFVRRAHAGGLAAFARDADADANADADADGDDDGGGELDAPAVRPRRLPSNAPPAAVRAAAAGAFADALAAGADDETAAAASLGVASPDALTDTQRAYAAAVASRLRQEAEAKAAAKAARLATFEAGKRAYAVGEWPAAVNALTKALDAEGPFTTTGGEVSLWLALALQACGREDESLALYRQVEAGHPNPKVRLQAANLRYIMEAPKLVVGRDERVELPTMSPDAARSQRPGERRRAAPARPATNKARVPKSLEDMFWEGYTPPRLWRNRYGTVAAAVLALAAAAYSATLGRP